MLFSSSRRNSSAGTEKRHIVGRRAMKRSVAILGLLLALGVLVRLVPKGRAPTQDARAEGRASVETPAAPVESGNSAERDLFTSYQFEPQPVRDLVARVAERYGRTARIVERTDGLRGLRLLDRMDLEAIFLYENQPAQFRRLAGLLAEGAAADLLVKWREYLGMKRADETDRQNFIAEIARLSSAQQRLAAQYPNLLPLILAEPQGMSELVHQLRHEESSLADLLAMLNAISLEHGSSDLRVALRTFDRHHALASDAFRRQGPEGFAVVALYGPIIEAVGDAMLLDDSLILLRVNSSYVDTQLLTHRPETLAAQLRHVAAVGLTELVGASPFGLQFVMEHGEPGERAMKQAGPDVAEVVLTDFDDPELRRQAVAAVSAHGIVALTVIEKYATDLDFREILRLHGAKIIAPIAQADLTPESLTFLQSKTKRAFTEAVAVSVLFASGDSGLAAIRTIKNDGIERATELGESDTRFCQFLPLYDVVHLGTVLRRGYSPTAGEMTWAMIDSAFVIADVLSLAGVQPEGAIAAESVRTEIKTAVREGARSASQTLAASVSESAGQPLARRHAAATFGRAGMPDSAAVSARLTRWWSVRSAGGLYRVLRQAPDALSRLSLVQTAEMAGALSAKAGMRLSHWRPVRFLRAGGEVVASIPPGRGLKYLAAQAIQAGVGTVGFVKMEEHLASLRPRS
jgi:hypothetical protein